MGSWKGVEGLSSQMGGVEVCDFRILTGKGSVMGLAFAWTNK